MTKIFSPRVESKKRIAIRMPKEMHLSVLSLLLKSGKSSRGLSLWVSQAICHLKELPEYWNIIAEEWLDKGENVSRPITLTQEAEIALSEMNAMFRCRHFEAQDVNSKIVRTAITQRIIYEETNEILV